jgi:hypothetical protein
MSFFLTLLLNILFGWLTASYAQARGRDPFIWFAVGAFFNLFGLLALFLLPDARNPEEKEKEQEETDSSAQRNETIEVKPSEVYTVTEFHQHEWFYYDTNRQQNGPIDFEQLKKLWISREINDATFIWHEGMSNWQKIGDLPKIKAVFERQQVS